MHLIQRRLRQIEPVPAAMYLVSSTPIIPVLRLRKMFW
jgi:hypothetical protein